MALSTGTKGPWLKNPAVLISAIQSGLSLTTWFKDSFAYAESFDETEKRYRGLRTNQTVPMASENPQGLLVKPEIAQKQIEAETIPSGSPIPLDGDGGPGRGEFPRPLPGDLPPEPEGDSDKPKRFLGTVTLDATRVGRDAGKIAEEVIAHL